MGIVALAFDNGFDIAIVLTKGTRALATQTTKRIREDFKQFSEADKVQIFDIMSIPSNLAGYELDQKLVIVAKKQADNLDRLVQFVTKAYPSLAQRRVLLIDDEADYASFGFRNSKSGVQANVTTHQIDGLREPFSRHRFFRSQLPPMPFSFSRMRWK